MEEKEKIEVQLAKISDEIKKLNSKLNGTLPRSKFSRGIRAKYYKELQQAEAEKLRLVALLNYIR
jgi:hypothetical protein